MKSLKYILTLITTITFLVSCDEDKWLEEVPYSFYSPENSYTSPEQIDLAVVKLYENVHTMLFGSAQNLAFIYQYTTDVGYDAISTTHALNSWSDKISPEEPLIGNMWTQNYKIISNANVILSRIQDIEYDSEDQKNAKIAEAKFFRAFAYRSLGILFGGVPLVLDEITTAKRDFTRATQDEVWDQVISDLTDAVADLPEATDVEQDGRLAKAAAYHLLAEMYIITENYDEAIAAATQVIDDPNYSLMTSRFGTRSGEEGDVYWDLFRRGNQNRGSGNSEAIWVSQYEYLTPGGGSDDNWARFIIPAYYQLKDNNGENVFIGPLNQLGGRGIGWWAPSDYILNQVWVNSNNDIRNSSHNIIRDAVVNNPASAYYGQMMVESGAIADFDNTLNKFWSAIFAKTAPINNLPDEVIDDPETGLTNTGARHSFRDHYIMRLAETYLLRAEAYMRKGDLSNAANDINVVRDRSNADPVNAADVNQDFILDERARELFVEEARLQTLMRMGVSVDRIRTYNPMHNGQYANHVINDTQNLLPIPNSEIEKNTEAILEQNPGY